MEHSAGATPEDKLKQLGASLENEKSFWFTQASLCNILRHVGFTSVYDCRNPLANLHISKNSEAESLTKIWGNRITLAAIKGQPVSLFVHPEATAELEADWPENLEEYFFEHYLKSATRLTGLTERLTGLTERQKGGLAASSGGSFQGGYDASSSHPFGGYPGRPWRQGRVATNDVRDSCSVGGG